MVGPIRKVFDFRKAGEAQAIPLGKGLSIGDADTNDWKRVPYL